MVFLITGKQGMAAVRRALDQGAEMQNEWRRGGAAA
jgi:hypothetical protein